MSCSKLNDGLARFSNMNAFAFGRSRDDHIVRLIKEGRAFTRKQIEEIIITNRKSSKRIAQSALSRLCKQERINKKVYAPQLPTVYYVGKKPAQIEHMLLINEVYCSLLTQRKPGVKIEWTWSYSILGDKVIADAMFIISEGNYRRVVFLEVERNADRRFKKDDLYQSVYDADWVNEEWSIIKDNTAIFPTILVITDYKLNVKSQLNFIVAPIDEIQKDIYGLLGR